MHLKLLATIAVVGLCSTFAPDVVAAEVKANPQQDPQVLVNRIRLRQMTQQLTLTDEQQKKCQAYLDEQAVLIGAVQRDTALPMDQKLKKQDAIAKEYKAKLKTTLTDEQRAKWDASEAKAAARKKRSSATAAEATPSDKAKEKTKPDSPAAPAPEKKAGA
jgi:hypothetical protein